MSTEFPIDTTSLWAQVSNRDAKEQIAKTIVSRAADGEVIGFGSGTTSMVCAIQFGQAVKEGLGISAVVTSYELQWLCEKLGIDVLSPNETQVSWCFDGADEIDPNGYLLKGRGGAMHRERVVFDSTQKRVVVADQSKDVAVLGEKFPAPIEVLPSLVVDVCNELNKIGLDSISIRTGQGKDGPIITESGNIIVDAIYRSGFSIDVIDAINKIEGVYDTGLFIGYDFERIS